VPELYDVAVIGGGPSGALVASSLASAGLRVIVLERRRAEAVEPCCTGIVGRPYLDCIQPCEDLVLAAARSAVLISPSGRRLHVAAAVDQAFVLDRALLERRLRHRAARAGAEMVEGVLVTRTRVTRDACEMDASGPDGSRRCFSRALVIAGGVNPGLLRQAGLRPPAKYMVGAHAELDMDGVDETEVYFLSGVAPGAFAWLVPMAPGRVRLGVLSPYSAGRLAERFLERAAIRARLRSREFDVSQRPVPVSASRRMHADRVVAVGDAAGQVKPTTGGGLYFGAMAATAAAAVLSNSLAKDDLSARALSSYETQWRAMFGRELRRGALARSVYSRLSPRRVDGIIETAARTGVAERLLASPSFSFDRHSGVLLSGLLRCLPGALPRPLAGSREGRA